MYKILGVVVLIITFSMPGWTGTITVSAPAPGDVLCKGRNYPVIWTGSAKFARVMVRLKQGSTVAANLSWDTENDGRFEFDVAASIPEGNYSIEVQSVDRSVKGESGVFRVSPCTMATVPPPPLEMAPQITNVHPNYEREITYVGGHFLVTWETRGRVSDLVNITLHPPDRSGRGTF